MSNFVQPEYVRALFLKNRRARYILIGALAAIAGYLVETKRRAHNQDEVKRKIPHRRSSAVHLYDGDSFTLISG